MVFLIHTELRCTVNHISDLLFFKMFHSKPTVRIISQFPLFSTLKHKTYFTCDHKWIFLRVSFKWLYELLWIPMPLDTVSEYDLIMLILIKFYKLEETALVLWIQVWASFPVLLKTDLPRTDTKKNTKATCQTWQWYRHPTTDAPRNWPSNFFDSKLFKSDAVNCWLNCNT